MYRTYVFDLVAVYYRYLRLKILTKCSSNTIMPILNYCVQFGFFSTIVILELVHSGLFFFFFESIIYYCEIMFKLFDTTMFKILVKIRLH